MSSSWEVRFSNSKQLPYFHDPVTGESSWEPPSGLSDAQIRSLPGATQYLVAGGASSGATNGKSDAHAGQVRASHLLVKHRESRRPSSWKDVSICYAPARAKTLLAATKRRLKTTPLTLAASKANITRSPAEAEEILRGHLTALGANPTPEKFAELAKVHS